MPVLTQAAITLDLIKSRGPSYGPVIDFDRHTASAPLFEEVGPPFGSGAKPHVTVTYNGIEERNDGIIYKNMRGKSRYSVPMHHRLVMLN